MKQIEKSLALVLISALLVSCFGDQKTVIGQEFGDTDFINDNFKGNKKDFSELPKDLCVFLDEATILKAYDNATSVTFNGENSFMNKNCQFAITYFNDASQFIKGSIFIVDDSAEEANWKESWEFKKKRYKSAAYVKDLGRAAIWYGKQRKLEIKMKDYQISITVPPKMIDKNKIDNDTDAKYAAIAIAESTNLF